MANKERISIRVVGSPNIDLLVHTTRKGKAKGKKIPTKTRAEYDAAMQEILDGASIRGRKRTSVAGNVTNVIDAFRKLQSRGQRFKEIFTRKHDVVAHITLGQDKYTKRIKRHRAFRYGRAKITPYDAPNIVNTVVNGGNNRDIVSFAPREIPGGFTVESKKSLGREVVYLTSVKGDHWHKTYHDVAEYKRKNPKALLAVAPGSQQMEEIKDPEDQAKRETARAAVYGAIKVADMLLVNKEEALELIGEKAENPNKLTPETILRRAKALGSDKMIISMTDGPDGSYAMDAENNVFYQDILAPSRFQKRLSSIPVLRKLAKEKKNTIGAGDAYAAAFVHALIEKHTIKEAMQMGTINADRVIKKHDASSGQVTRRGMNRLRRNLSNVQSTDIKGEDTASLVKSFNA